MADFPNVPDVLGVPPIPRDPRALLQLPALIFADNVLLLSSGGWGVYQGGAQVVTPDTFVSIDFKREWAIADYPVERGGFQSYDKVATPFLTRVSFASGGSEANRQMLLDQVDAIAGTLEFYDVVTPEQVYTNVNVQRYDFRRMARDGVGIIIIDLWLTEIRESASQGDQTAQSPSGQPRMFDGNVQLSSVFPPTLDAVQYLFSFPMLGQFNPLVVGGILLQIQ